MRIIIYGLGQRFKKYENVFSTCDVEAVCDRIQSRNIKYTQIKPEEVTSKIYDFVVVTPRDSYEEIAGDLVLNYAVPDLKIINLEYFLYLMGEMEENQSWRSLKKRIDSSRFNARDYYFSDDWNIATRDDISEIKQGDGKEVVNIGGTLLCYKHDKCLFQNYVVSHKKYHEIALSDYKTIWVGEEGKKYKEHGLNDGVGDNIQEFNHLINECTALYWVWKNENNDYVGFSHYRRYLSSPINLGMPIRGWEAQQILSEYDVIAAEPVSFFDINNYEQMISHIDNEAVRMSLDVIREAFARICPEDETYLNIFLDGHYLFPCQMFVMDQAKFNEYCSWLFPIVFHLIENLEIKDAWNDYSKRIIGFWAERLFTIWLLKTGYTIYERPVIFLEHMK